MILEGGWSDLLRLATLVATHALGLWLASR